MGLTYGDPLRLTVFVWRQVQIKVNSIKVELRLGWRTVKTLLILHQGLAYELILTFT